MRLRQINEGKQIRRIVRMNNVVNLTKKQGEFFKVKNCSVGGRLKEAPYSKNYIKELLYEEPRKKSEFKGISIKLNK